MTNIRNRKQTCLAPPVQDEWWVPERFVLLFFLPSLHGGWVVHCETITTILFCPLPHSLFFLSILLSLHLSFPASPLWPTYINVDKDRHMQGGQQCCLASGSGLWQQISMRVDNGTRSECNAFCQPRNSVCHSRPFSMLGELHELRCTRKIYFL